MAYIPQNEAGPDDIDVMTYTIRMTYGNDIPHRPNKVKKTIQVNNSLKRVKKIQGGLTSLLSPDMEHRNIKDNLQE